MLGAVKVVKKNFQLLLRTYLYETTVRRMAYTFSFLLMVIANELLVLGLYIVGAW
jgi:hypothetical protein